METKQWKTLDRSRWANGPWDDEPDKVQWQDEETGLPCLIVRNSSTGILCGYVGVDANHPSFGQDYNEVHVDVHGGLTFSNFCSPGASEDRGICHVPGAGEPDHVWWLGFDCGHYGDYSPYDAYRSEHEADAIWRLGPDQQYRTVGYVKGQCQELARQLADMGK